MTGLTGFFLSSTGRSGRRAVWLGLPVLIALWWAFDRFASGSVRTWTSWLVVFALFVSGCSILARRLHDRGRSGWWSGLIVAAFMIVWPGPETIVDFLCLVVLGWAAVDLGVLGGEPVFNRFGHPLSAQVGG